MSSLEGLLRFSSLSKERKEKKKKNDFILILKCYLQILCSAFGEAPHCEASKKHMQLVKANR